jgi:L-ascorbate metabolism protein UlaG (beta-lactamase superfamily)
LSERVTYLGHATTLIETGGARLLTDPVLRSRIAHIRRHAAPPSPPHLEDVDAVLISHGHADHLDPPSLRLLGRDVTVIVPRGLGRLLGRRRLGEARELGAGERARVGSVTITAVPAAHDGRRLPVGPRVSALGYLIEGGSRTYFAGDTDLFEGMREIGPDLDLALLPIAGWGPRVGAGHLDPERAARATALLRPRVVVPIHWGTLAVGWRPRGDPEADAREFERLVRERVPGVEVRVLEPGQSTPLRR